jgi:hypothetical protein
MAIPIAKIIEQRSHLVPGKDKIYLGVLAHYSFLIGKLKITEHFFEVPRDYAKPSSGSLRLFARSAKKVEKPAEPEEDDPKKKQLPWLV